MGCNSRFIRIRRPGRGSGRSYAEPGCVDDCLARPSASLDQRHADRSWQIGPGSNGYTNVTERTPRPRPASSIAPGLTPATRPVRVPPYLSGVPSDTCGFALPALTGAPWRGRPLSPRCQFRQTMSQTIPIAASQHRGLPVIQQPARMQARSRRMALLPRSILRAAKA